MSLSATVYPDRRFLINGQSKCRPLERHEFRVCKTVFQKEQGMQFAMLIYESPKTFELRKSDGTDAYTGAWRAYYKALVEAGVYVGGDPLEAPETGTTIKIRDEKRRVQDGPYADTKEQLGGLIVLEVPSLDEALEWAARCPTAAEGAIEVRPLAPHTKQRIVE
jgi:hypothetical protein